MRAWWLVPGSTSCAAVRARGVLGHVLREPKHLLYWYLMLMFVVIPPFSLLSVLEAYLTWVSVVVVNWLGMWYLMNLLASLVLYPGSSTLYSRSMELHVATDVQAYVEFCVGDLQQHLMGNKLVLNPRTLPECRQFIGPVANTLKYTTMESNEPGVKEFVKALGELNGLIDEWETGGANNRLLQCCGVILMHTRLLIDCQSPPPPQPLASKDENDGEIDGEEEDHSRKQPLQTIWLLLVKQLNSFLQAKRAFKGIVDFNWARRHLELALGGKCEFVRQRIEICTFAPLSNTNTQQVVILCSPNAVRFEVYALYPDWIEFYREMGMHVVVWNYRGFGRSLGSPSPSAAREDIEAIVHHLQSRFTQFAFHGESIGGIPACFAASTNAKHLLIADRTFASLDAIAESVVGRRATTLLHYCTLGWEANNVANFMQFASLDNRLVMQDGNDLVIKHSVSLKMGLARLVCGPVTNAQDAKAVAIKLGQLLAAQPVPESLARMLQLLLQMECGSGQLFKQAVMHTLQGGNGSTSPIQDWFISAAAFGDLQRVHWVLDELDQLLDRDGNDTLKEISNTLRSLCSNTTCHNPVLRGVLVPLYCGHSGQPTKTDRDRISQLFQRAGWLLPTA
ncbi:hypothetical protein BASA81_006414 [Batrachochytrium salamandrivorans]|nr:hypothetical protein BASA81_006414 [Batrachochytrium salamandrivorans]